MNESFKGKSKAQIGDQLQLLELMQRIREAWLEARLRRIEVIQELHC